MPSKYSMKDFRPQTLAEKKELLESQLLEIDKQKDPFINRKHEIELELSKITNYVRSNGQFKEGEYAEICKQQDNLKTEKTGIEKKLVKFKQDKQKTVSAKQMIELQMRRVPKEKVKEELLVLRDKYLSFAADTTRVSSMRAMASRFVEEIQTILTSIGADV